MIGQGTLPNSPMADCMTPMAMALSDQQNGNLAWEVIKVLIKELFTFRMCAAHDEQHAAHLGGGMHKYANGKNQYKVDKVLAVIITVTIDRLGNCNKKIIIEFY